MPLCGHTHTQIHTMALTSQTVFCSYPKKETKLTFTAALPVGRKKSLTQYSKDKKKSNYKKKNNIKIKNHKWQRRWARFQVKTANTLIQLRKPLCELLVNLRRAQQVQRIISFPIKEASTALEVY